MNKRTSTAVERGRAAFAARAWEDAYQGLMQAEKDGSLDFGQPW